MSQIIGHGIDIVEIARIAKSIEAHGERFIERCFTVDEARYASSARSPRDMQRFAARFAAKEAAMKALGTGWSRGIAWTDIEVRVIESGAPELILSGRAGQIADDLGIQKTIVSLSHTD